MTGLRKLNTSLLLTGFRAQYQTTNQSTYHVWPRPSLFYIDDDVEISHRWYALGMSMAYREEMKLIQGVPPLTINRELDNCDEYRMFEKKFIDLFDKPEQLRYFDNLINSVIDKEDLDKNKEVVLKFISEIKNDYQFLNYFHEEGKIQDKPNSKVQSLIDWSNQMERQIDYMTVAFSESEPVNSHPQTTIEAQNQARPWDFLEESAELTLRVSLLLDSVILKSLFSQSY
ncbi:hypothetical protein ACTXT7_008110 [Hymenolepis weldensis]